MHLAGRQTGRTILLTRLTLRCHVRTRGAGGLDLGLEGRQLGLEGSDLVFELSVVGLELSVLVLELGVLGDEGEDIHCWLGSWTSFRSPYLG